MLGLELGVQDIQDDRPGPVVVEESPPSVDEKVTKWPWRSRS